MRFRGLALGLVLLLPVGAFAIDGEIPSQFAPFEHLIGPWKGTAIPAANKLKGWPETHFWSWKFVKGAPVGITVEFKGSKDLKSAVLSYDQASKKYTLDALDPREKPLTFQGTLDPTGKFLVLDRTTEVEGAKERLTIRLLPENAIRYNLWLDRREPGVPQFKRTLDVGLTKEGEALAAGSGVSDLPKCIITGGAAGMSVAYMGVSYPICCSGCRDEFNESPEKYVKKAALRAAGAPASKTPASSKTGEEDAEGGSLVGGNTKSVAMPKEKAKTKDAPKAEDASAKAAPSQVADAEGKALQLLKQAQTLEKTGKATGALAIYRRILKELPNTPPAKVAAERVKALNP